MFFNARRVPRRLDAFLSGICRTDGPAGATSLQIGTVMIVPPWLC